MKSSIQYKTITVPAGQPKRVDIRGNFISFDALPAALGFRFISEGQFVPCKLNVSFQMDGTELFNMVEFQNKGVAPVTVGFYFGIGALTFIG